MRTKKIVTRFTILKLVFGFRFCFFFLSIILNILDTFLKQLLQKLSLPVLEQVYVQFICYNFDVTNLDNIRIVRILKIIIPFNISSVTFLIQGNLLMEIAGKGKYKSDAFNDLK
jgi:hypothetical protein